MPGEKDFRKARAHIVRGRTALLGNTRDEIVRLLKQADVQIRAILAARGPKPPERLDAILEALKGLRLIP